MKCEKSKNSHYLLILQGFMNTRRGKAKLINFIIPLDIFRISTIVMNNLTSKLEHKDSTNTVWQTQAGNFTTNEM